MKRGQIWISAVLYIALGVILITIILAAGVPLVEKLRDRNTFLQTKELMYIIDDNIRIVATEGAGSKRFLSPLNIDKGELIIDEKSDEIAWRTKTRYKAMESGTDFREGALVLSSQETNIEDEFLLIIKLVYSGLANITLDSQFNNPFVGTYSLLIEHTGVYNNDVPVIRLNVR